MSKETVRILIVGAGVAGLGTAMHLRKAGFRNVTILEASNRVGGRILSICPREGDGVVELGGTVIHGASPENPFYKLASDWGLTAGGTAVKMNSIQFRQEDGKEIDRLLVAEVWDYYQELERNLSKLYKSNVQNGVYIPPASATSCATYVQNAKSEILQNFPEGQKRDAASRVLNCMFNYMRLMNGDDLDKVSADLVGCYKTFPGPDFLFANGGCLSFPERIHKELPSDSVLFNKEVVQVIWKRTENKTDIAKSSASDSGVKTVCKDGEEFESDHIVITCPLGHLKANYKQIFVPPLPESKAGAIERLGFGSIAKLFVYYDNPFWQEGIRFAWSDASSEQIDKSNWIKSVWGFGTTSTNPKVLGYPFAGKASEIMETLSEEEISTTCRDLLHQFLNDPSIPSPTMVLRSNWNSNPFIRGSYTYLGLESKVTDIDDLSSPLPSIDNPVLLFAGEATHPDFYSTIHGALLSGLRESQRLEDLYK